MCGKTQWKQFTGNIFTWLECEVFRDYSQYELVNLNLLVILCSSFFVMRFPLRFGRRECNCPQPHYLFQQNSINPLMPN
jgi:hypothetical protein